MFPIWCHVNFESSFTATKSTKKQIKQTGIPGIRFFNVIFTGTMETLVMSSAG